MPKKIAAGLLFMLFAVPAFAAIPHFKEIDTNGDGSISQGEALTAGISERLFAKLDLDKNEKLSADEYNILSGGRS